VDSLALIAEILTALLTVCGIVYSVMALWAARRFERAAPSSQPAVFTPSISILKPIKGVDSRMHAALASHCAQNYAGSFELLFGVSSLSDPAVAEVARLRVEYPHIDIRLIDCPQRLGPNGKLSNLAQMLPHARNHSRVLLRFRGARRRTQTEQDQVIHIGMEIGRHPETSKAFRIEINADRMRVLTVPKGCPVFAAISVCVCPSKKAISSVLR